MRFGELAEYIDSSSEVELEGLLGRNVEEDRCVDPLLPFLEAILIDVDSNEVLLVHREIEGGRRQGGREGGGEGGREGGGGGLLKCTQCQH